MVSAFINVLIVDDHELVRIGIKRLLSDITGIKVVGECNSGEEAIKYIRANNADVVLMDIQMPGIGGLEATKKMLRYNPELKIIILTVCNDEPFPSRLLQAGVAGYLTKDCTADEMVKAIRKVFAGQRHISPGIAEQLALKRFTDSPLDHLSERELQVMLMIIKGEKVPAIADKLCLSPKTVNSYRYRLFEKLGVTNDVELTLLAMRLGVDADKISAAS